MKLLSFKRLPYDAEKNCFKFSFEVQSRDGKVNELIFKEKPNWPLLDGATLQSVEKWLLETYLNDISFATFGAI